MTGAGQFLADKLADLDVDHGLVIDQGSVPAHWRLQAEAALERAREASRAKASAKNSEAPNDDVHEIF